VGDNLLNVAVEAKNVVKDFGSVVALDGLNFHINEGEIFGLIGLNGAGKTTMLRITSTLLLPTSGIVTVFGHDVVDKASEVRNLITYLPEEAGAYKNLSGYEYLRFMASFRTKDKATIEELVDAAAEISGLGDRLKDRVKGYSKGMKRRLLVARALMTKPKLAILDEPNSGLDVLHSVHVRTLIKRYAKEYNVTILLSSHNMLEVEYLCDRVALVNKGKVVIEGSPEELKAKHNAVNLEEVFGEVVGFV
jgi:ABC-2 type transport system ATP-binding protein